MGDRTALEVHVYDCPAESVQAVLDVLEEYGLELEWMPTTFDELHLGSTYGDYEAYGDTSEHIVQDIAKVAPLATVDAWTSPKYDWLGSYMAYVPGLGFYQADCDDSGAPQFTYGEIKGWLDEAPPSMTVQEFQAAVLNHKTGKHWSDRIIKLLNANASKTLKP